MIVHMALQSLTKDLYFKNRSRKIRKEPVLMFTYMLSEFDD